jgi:hypothetical protein
MTLFDPGAPILPPRPTSAEERRTARRRALLAAGIHPTTKVKLRTPAGETCSTCQHLAARRLGRTYYKCDTVEITGGPATDVRLSWPACERWE